MLGDFPPNSEPQGCEWGQRRWLEDDSASCCQCWTQFPGGHKQGEIPRNDLTNDADGLSQRIGEVIAWHGDGNGVPFNLGGPARHVAEQIHGQGDISRTGFRDALPHNDVSKDYGCVPGRWNAYMLPLAEPR